MALEKKVLCAIRPWHRGAHNSCHCGTTTPDPLMTVSRNPWKKRKDMVVITNLAQTVPARAAFGGAIKPLDNGPAEGPAIRSRGRVCRLLGLPAP